VASFLQPGSTMRCRQLVLMVGLYLCLDLTNPFVGCAFAFDVDASVDGVARQHQRLSVQTGVAALPVQSARATIGTVRTASARRTQARPLDDWFVQLRQAHAPLSDPQSATEDH
jgi:hypothetical protein